MYFYGASCTTEAKSINTLESRHNCTVILKPALKHYCIKSDTLEKFTINIFYSLQEIFFFFVNPLTNSLSVCGDTQPKIVEALLGYELVQVSCGASHVLAVTNEREVFAWGRGDNGKRQYSFFFFPPPRNTQSSFAICLHVTLRRTDLWQEHHCVASLLWSVCSCFERSPRAGHPRHPQLSAAGVFTRGI